MSLSDIVYNIRHAVYAKKVREAIASAIEEISNKEDKNLETYNNMVIGAGESNAEIVDARLDNNTGTRYEKVGKRLDKISSEIDENVNALDARIDNIIAIAGDGTIPSELSDIRVNNKGETFSTANARIKNTENKIENKIENIDNKLYDYYKNIIETKSENYYNDINITDLDVKNGYVYKSEKYIKYNKNSDNPLIITCKNIIDRFNLYDINYIILGKKIVDTKEKYIVLAINHLTAKGWLTYYDIENNSLFKYISC